MGAWFDTVTLTHSSRDGCRGRDGGKVEVEGRGVGCEGSMEGRGGRDAGVETCWITLNERSVVVEE